MGLLLSSLRQRFLLAITPADHVDHNGTNQLLPGMEPGGISQHQPEPTAHTAIDIVPGNNGKNGTNQLFPGMEPREISQQQQEPAAHTVIDIVPENNGDNGTNQPLPGMEPREISQQQQEPAAHTVIDIVPRNNGENGTNQPLPGMEPREISQQQQEPAAHTVIDIVPGNNGDNLHPHPAYHTGTESNDHDHIKTIFTLYISGHALIVATATSMRGHAVSSAERKIIGFLSALVSTGGIATFVVISFQGFTHRRGAGQPLRESLVENSGWLTKRAAIVVFFSMLSVSFGHICNLMLKSHHQ